MSGLFKTMARELVVRTPVLREHFFDHEFARRPQSFRGVYSSFSEALADAPQDRLVGYDHEEVATLDEPNLENLNGADYPILFWLSRFLPETCGVIDLGGNLGVAYYAYRRFLEFPEELRWTVCEVSETVRAGRALAKKLGVKQLEFVERMDAASQSDVFFTAGALQYIEESLAQMLAGLPKLPAHVLVQRVPLQGAESFVTLQNNGAWVVPYKVGNEESFIKSVTGLGYELVDQWKTSRVLQVLAHPVDREARYQGMYFRLR
jgi:putative methyltransferase (TIGR04325 family)